MPTISVVIPTYNRASDLERCLQALAAQTIRPTDFEVLVIDDGSSDETAVVVQAAAARSPVPVRYVHQTNAGPAAARNLGIRLSSSELVVFTDDDCLPEPDWLQQLVLALPANPRCAGIGGSIMRLRDTWISRFIDTVGPLNHGRKGDHVLYLVTASALYRRSCLVEVDGFDETISWPGGEDPDLSFRLRKLGYSLAATPNAVTRHNHHDTLRGLYQTFYRYGRGDSARIQLGRMSALGRWPLPLFLLCTVGHTLVCALRFLVQPNLRLGDRLTFGWLRLVANAGVFVGYCSCPQLIARQRLEEERPPVSSEARGLLPRQER